MSRLQLHHVPVADGGTGRLIHLRDGFLRRDLRLLLFLILGGIHRLLHGLHAVQHDRFLRGLLLLRHERGLLLSLTPDRRVVLDLLGRGQGIELHFQLHRLCDVLSLGKPENHVIAFLDAFLLLAVPQIKLRELISPALGVFVVLVFPKDLNLVVERGLFRAKQLVFQNIAGRVVGRVLLELIEELFRLVEVSRPDIQLADPVEHRLAGGGAPVSVLHDAEALLVPVIRLVDLADHQQCPNALHMPPVNLISHVGCAAEIAGLRQRIDLLQLADIFCFIHFVYPFSTLPSETVEFSIIMKIIQPCPCCVTPYSRCTAKIPDDRVCFRYAISGILCERSKRPRRLAFTRRASGVSCPRICPSGRAGRTTRANGLRTVVTGAGACTETGPPGGIIRSRPEAPPSVRRHPGPEEHSDACPGQRTGSRCQISSTYSRIVRSEENLPAEKVFIIAIFAQRVRSRYASSTFRCASA